MLTSERFLLRPFELSDANDLFELDSDPLVHQFLGNKLQTEVQQAKDVIEKVQKQYKDFGIGRYAVIDKQTGEFVGWCGLKYELDRNY